MVIEAFRPARCGSLPDLWTVQPVLQGGVAADGVEAPVPTDGALIWPFLGETLAHDGLGGWAAAGPHPRGGLSQGTAQPMAVAPKCFPDASRFWTLPLPSITNRKGRVIREPQLQGGKNGERGQTWHPGTCGRRGTQGTFSPQCHLLLLPPCACSLATPNLGKGEMDTYS